MTEEAAVTAAEIARLSGVGRAAVSNWRRRHEDFPQPAGGTDTSPVFKLSEVQAWLQGQGKLNALSGRELVWQHLEAASGTDLISDALAAAGTYLANGSSGKMFDENTRNALDALASEDGAEAAFEQLHDRFVEANWRGVAVTPRELARLMVDLTEPHGTVFDPACGTGALLRAAVRSEPGIRPVGQELDPSLAQVAIARLAFAAGEASVRSGDSLRNDAFPELVADVVVSNPPFNIRNWGAEELAYDRRWVYGVPPKGESELAWVQHCLAHLRPGGHAVVLMPPAVASRRSGRPIRAELLRSGTLRAVVALPPGAAAPLHVGLQIWVLRRPEPGGADRRTVLFIDTAGEQHTHPPEAHRGSTGRTSPRVQAGRQVVGWDTLSATVLGHWRAFSPNPECFTDAPGTTRAIPAIDLLDDLVDVSPARHVRISASTADPIAVAKHANELRDRLTESATTLAASPIPAGWRPVGEESRSWRTATVADLSRGGALTLHRTVPAVRGSKEINLPEEPASRRVLTGRDVATDARASAGADEQRSAIFVLIEPGDVLLSGVAAGRGAAARVADGEDAGCLLGLHVHLFRPAPDRLDPWFLAGFLSAADNVSSASTGTTAVHIDPRRLRVPLLPLIEQRRYGGAFRQMHELRTTARQVAKLATETAGTLAAGLTSGALAPPDVDCP
ncbi:N-6 DNA methylase [Actinosynnema mirum]|uniref:N-6 DNA methylase n=1 Tax=Actinosynnema mirum (strain ATCC 29888 / DSM 43827 / JCM 3225 / NBRC 14064 / NCIMB 13271 / NRRL B-12336 / IMRU 3971 / 101) TaxID=446462 RepID=C6WNK1_ACTMD|nr:N-6 DNA methylase [Actinosynnema mirum]ACU34920.1 N-6 DNA methylase [Actinosynnema mirum DSM 43827]